MNIYSGADATKYSILEPENLAVTYKRDLGDTYEVFSSLISTGIFNVCQYYSPNNKDLYSIPITSDWVKEKSKMCEVIADLALIDLVFWTGWDVTVIPRDEYRDKHWELIVWNNCRVFPNGVYSRFDIDCISFNRYSDIQILEKMVESILSFYNTPYINRWSLIVDELGNSENWFWNRILSKANQLLWQYEWELWKIFFITQYIRAKSMCWENTSLTDDEVNTLTADYSNFIDTLTKVSKIFFYNRNVLLQYIGSKRMKHKQIIFHLKSVFYILMWKEHKIPSDIMHLR